MKKSILFSIISMIFTIPLLSQTKNLYVEGTGEQLGVIHTTSTGTSIAGIELLRGNQFNGTDWKMINDGGVFKLMDGIDNFSTEGDENLRIGTSGTLTLLEGSEASLGDASGILIVGDPDADNLAIDRNELLARHGSGSASLFLQAGLNAGNTVLNSTNGNVGIGHAGPQVKLSVQGSVSQNPASPVEHISLIYNTHSTGGADVLALKVGQDDPGTASNFITFFDGNNDILGRIEGNGSGGVSFESNSADFAEYLAKESATSTFSTGDVVGIKGGKISLNTVDADRAMVITDQPIVVGNAQNDPDQFEKVSFIGQVPVRVTGMVKAGDWIVASGKNDGTAVAVSTSEIALEHQIIGQALESSSHDDLKLIKALVGLDNSEAKGSKIIRLQRDLQTQTETNEKQERTIERLQSQINELRKFIQMK